MNKPFIKIIIALVMVVSIQLLPANEFGPDAASGAMAEPAALSESSTSPREAADEAACATGSRSYYSNVPHLVQCSEHLCVHWTTEGQDAVDSSDGDADRVPDQVENVIRIAEQAWAKVVIELGLRAPRSDLRSSDHGPDERLDIYLTDVGGYVTSDDPDRWRPDCAGSKSVSAVIAITNRAIPEAELRNLIFHEFFHAVQFAYDYVEDAWLMEGTAEWINVITHGKDGPGIDCPIFNPMHPLDKEDARTGTPAGQCQYSPLFWQFLSQDYGSASAPDGSIIRDILERAAGGGADPDNYSLEAVENVVQTRGDSFQSIFGRFAAVNDHPSTYYPKPRLADYYRPPRTSFRLGPLTRTTGPQVRVQDHLTSSYVSVLPDSGLSATDNLQIDVDLPDQLTMPASTIVLYMASSAIYRIPLSLDATGNGSTVVPFGQGVAEVAVVLSNASTRFRDCREGYSEFEGGTGYSCSGSPVDDGKTYAFTASLTARPASALPPPEPSQAPPSPTPTASPSPSFSPTPSPTPAPTDPPPEQPQVVSHDRRVSLRLSNHLQAKGVVEAVDGFDGCQQDVGVKIQRKTWYGWRSVKLAITRSDGTFSARIPDRSGIYRAHLPRLSKLENVCGRAVSVSRRHRHDL